MKSGKEVLAHRVRKPLPLDTVGVDMGVDEGLGPASEPGESVLIERFRLIAGGGGSNLGMICFKLQK